MNLIEQIRVNDVSIDGYQGTYYDENPEWVRVILDSEDKVLAGIKADGTVEWSTGVPTPVKEYVELKLEEQLDQKVDKEEKKSLIDSSVADSISYAEIPEWIDVKIDSKDKILEGIKVDGTKVIELPLEIQGVRQETIDNPEFIEVKIEHNGRVIEGIRENGDKVIGGNLEVGGSITYNGKNLVKKDFPTILFPDYIYTVCNDINRVVADPKGNYAQSIYLTHLIENLSENTDIRFKDGGIESLLFVSPITISNSISTGAKWNSLNRTEDNDLLEIRKEIVINGGSEYKDTSFNITHRSILNSATKDVIPRVLCIGDSITWGEGSEIPLESPGHSGDIYPYHIACQKLFVQDNIYAGEPSNEYKCIFLGKNKIQRSVTFNNITKSYETFNCGIRGITCRQYYKPQDDPYPTDGTREFMDENGYFSLKAFIDGYRTLDDNGNKLSIDSPDIGTNITAANIDSYNVCVPTHVVLMLGANDKSNFNILQYKYIVEKIKQEYPSIIIGCALSDTAGTFFPNAYRYCPQDSIIWNNNDGSVFHSNQFKNMTTIKNEMSNKEDNGIYVLPFMFVHNTIDAFWYRKVLIPGTEHNLLQQYGWGSSVHINGLAHAQLGYCLYSWIKYSIYKHLI